MDNIYKVVACGDDNTGKASSVERLVSEDFTQNYNPTLGVEFHPIYFFTQTKVLSNSMHGTVLALMNRKDLVKVTPSRQTKQL